jgi:hypothetical protein
VLDNLSRDSLHVKGFPCKHIKVRFEEVNECAFLFRIECHPDTECAAVIGDNRILDVLGRLERPGRTIGRLEDIRVLGGRFGVDPLELEERLSELKTLRIAFVYVLEHSPTVMTPFGPRIFNLRYI